MRVRRLVYCFVIAGAVAAFAPAPAPAQDLEGERLFEESCASCHGPGGEGTAVAPPLEGVGEAAVDFQLRTGRMPLADPDAQAMRKEPAFDADEIEAIVAYVSSLGPGGPAIPSVDAAAGDISDGERLFVENCAACHGATATGGAVGNVFAPTLSRSEPLDVAEAVVTGPGQMPVFAFTDHERNSIIRYVEFLKDNPAPGGLDVGGVGPVPEGFVAWGVGIGLLLATVLFVAQPWRKSP